MTTKSAIEWTETTWSPVIGCTKVSQGCKNCYAEREVVTRWSKNPKSIWYGRSFTRIDCRPEALSGPGSPLAWKKARRIFVCPRADLFHEYVPHQFLDRVFAAMAECPQHTFQVLTKRADRMRAYLSDPDLEDRLTELWRDNGLDRDTWSLMLPLKNVWLGVSVEDQATADERIPQLLDTPAYMRWISAEPLLGPIDLGPDIKMADLDSDRGLSNPGLDWVVAGGESGPDARPSHPDWFRGLRDQCKAAGTAFLFKQWGEWNPGTVQEAVTAKTSVRVERSGAVHSWPPAFSVSSGDWCMHKVGKRAAGRLLDGVMHDDYPAEVPL